MCNKCPNKITLIEVSKCKCPCYEQYIKDGKCNICGHKLDFYKKVN